MLSRGSQKDQRGITEKEAKLFELNLKDFVNEGENGVKRQP